MINRQTTTSFDFHLSRGEIRKDAPIPKKLKKLPFCKINVKLQNWNIYMISITTLKCERLSYVKSMYNLMIMRYSVPFRLYVF